MLYAKQIFLLFILLEWTNAVAIESKINKLMDGKDGMEMEVKMESTSERLSESTSKRSSESSPESTTVENVDYSTLFNQEMVYYSIIDSPVQCKTNERVDYNGRCREVF